MRFESERVSNDEIGRAGLNEEDQLTVRGNVLLIGSGLMIRSFQQLRNVDPGFRDANELLTFRVSVPSAEASDPLEAFQVQRSIIDGLAGIPGVDSAAMVTSVTMDTWNSSDPIFVESQPTPEGQLPEIFNFKWAGPDYFATMGNPLVVGRDGESGLDLHRSRSRRRVALAAVTTRHSTPPTTPGRL